jgi:hypothetical protein
MTAQSVKEWINQVVASNEIEYSKIVNEPARSFVHDFGSSLHIVVEHNMEKKPSVRVIDFGGNEWFPSKINYDSNNQITLEFDTDFSGRLFLS